MSLLWHQGSNSLHTGHEFVTITIKPPRPRPHASVEDRRARVQFWLPPISLISLSRLSFFRHEAQWLSDSVLLFHTTGPEFKSKAGQGRFSYSYLQWVDKWLAWELNTGGFYINLNT
ncbi:hypothetical protein TNCV_4709141 [Trichonephila clavipes]|nr:hypothetical protein TNCV_4709141 [Trichonephila clavipes]